MQVALGMMEGRDSNKDTKALSLHSQLFRLCFLYYPAGSRHRVAKEATSGSRLTQSSGLLHPMKQKVCLFPNLKTEAPRCDLTGPAWVCAHPDLIIALDGGGRDNLMIRLRMPNYMNGFLTRTGTWIFLFLNCIKRACDEIAEKNRVG